MRLNKTIFFSMVLMIFLSLNMVYGDAIINGKIIHATTQAPMQGIDVVLSSASQQIVKSDKNGYYQFAKVPVGSYKVEAKPPQDYEVLGINPVDVKITTKTVGVNFSLDVIKSNIEGVVINALTDLPISGVAIKLIGSIHRSTFTDQQGSYRFEDLPPGGYTIQIDVPKDFVLLSPNFIQLQLPRDINKREFWISEALRSNLASSAAAQRFAYPKTFQIVL